MTIGAIVGLSILSLLVVLCVIGIGAYYKKAIVPCVIVGVLILGVSWGIAAWYFSSPKPESVP